MARTSKAAGRRITAGEDKAYDTADHVTNLRAMNVTQHVTQNRLVSKTGKTRQSAIGRVAASFLLNLIAYNLIRIPNC